MKLSSTITILGMWTACTVAFLFSGWWMAFGFVTVATAFVCMVDGDSG